jgi:hypothetical protein
VVLRAVVDGERFAREIAEPRHARIEFKNP